jgi:hypothetical protein
MTDRLADISARIDGIRQLGAVVNAMKGIAAARASTARAEIEAIDSYAATIAAAISDALGPAGPLHRPGRPAARPAARRSCWSSAPNRVLQAPSASAFWTASKKTCRPPACS